ncbi:MAG: hypothetical protein GW849_13955, partial [Flavobacteriia bacterium]|nr:hypothetical protein [Flavobacteriia bacterium]
IVSVSLPPIQVPTKEPMPKQVIIHPTCGKVKPRELTKYKDKKGITIAPALLIKVTNAKSQISLDRPLKEAT